jgi:hypothetical protein
MRAGEVERRRSVDYGPCIHHPRIGRQGTHSFIFLGTPVEVNGVTDASRLHTAAHRSLPLPSTVLEYSSAADRQIGLRVHRPSYTEAVSHER